MLLGVALAWLGPRSETTPAATPTADALAAPSIRIDLNRDAAGLLMNLPRIGERRARAIIRFRERNGPFRCIDDLVKVPGIGAVTIDRLRPHARVNAPPLAQDATESIRGTR